MTKVSKNLNNYRVHSTYAKRYREREELLEKLVKCYDIEILRNFLEKELVEAREKRVKEERAREYFGNFQSH